MSRIGNKPVVIPSGVKVAVDGQNVSVEGPKGKLQQTFRPEVKIALDDDSKHVVVSVDSSEREVRAFHGLTRSLIQNMVVGVQEGYAHLAGHKGQVHLVQHQPIMKIFVVALLDSL